MRKIAIIPFLFFCLIQATAYSQSEQKIDSLQKSLSIHIEENDTIEIFKTYYSIGNIFYNTSRYFESNIYYKEALKYANSGQKLKIYNKQGVIFWFNGEYDNAISQYRMVLRISENTGNKKYQAMSLNNIGFIYAEYDKYEKTLDYYKQALEIRMEMQDKKGIGLSYNSIGRVYYGLDSLDKSLEYFTKALEIFREIKYPLGESNALNSMGNVYLGKKQFKFAMQLFYESLEIRKKIQHSHLIAESYKNIANIYIQKSDYKNAELVIEEGIRISNEIQSIKMLKQFYYLLYELNQQRRNYEEALTGYLKFTEIKDSLLSIESENRIAELEIQYQTEKKEQQIEILDKENQLKQQQLDTQKYLLVVAIISIILIVAVSMLLFRQNKLKSRLNIEQNKQKLLRSQMNPHFIYNSLSAIQNFILSNNSMESVTYISEFSGLMRLVLENSRKDLITLKEDIDFVNHYLKLQKLRFSDKFNYSVFIDDNINTEIVKIPPMLIQPCIENAVEHGMRQIEKDGIININYKLLKSDLKISIIDNGVGYAKTEENRSKHKSLATVITKERIDNVAKLFNINIKMDISEAFPEKENKGVRVDFIIPQKK
ncbi:MAG: tetratricopeptide repeat protein [Bacteroidales bacterium]|nr:tetratricopeptide repeat protein [Bacteroidales bacterium]